MTWVETTKLTPSIDVTRKIGAFSATSSWTGHIAGPAFYDISRDGMQPGELENRQLWLTGDRMAKCRDRVEYGYPRLEICIPIPARYHSR
jgi:hypothetical protein